MEYEKFGRTWLEGLNYQGNSKGFNAEIFLAFFKYMSSLILLQFYDDLLFST